MGGLEDMPDIAKEICKNIRKADLKPDDLLSSGILFEGSLRTNQSKLYNILEKKQTYSYNFVNSLIEFVFLNTNVEMRWDGSPCQLTKFREIKGDGPIQYPDIYENERLYYGPKLWTVSKNGTISNGQVTDHNLLEETKISDNDTVTSVFTPES
ncbi:12699_t:CDS:2 [Racocetra fulgida]|uniref:12699_t:CDS:1 n=1 Tax=Racocetra fulgida TaxID=60492 RepID=A0A9N9EM22_9GLOM|nr:12699_t:CDS:2 [Racocetra fulgida]